MIKFEVNVVNGMAKIDWTTNKQNKKTSQMYLFLCKFISTAIIVYNTSVRTTWEVSLFVQQPLWQCFLMQPAMKQNESAVVSQDNAKLQCCTKATSTRCRQLCTKVATNQISLFNISYRFQRWKIGISPVTCRRLRFRSWT